MEMKKSPLSSLSGSAVILGGVSSLRSQLESYEPFNEQEERDRLVIEDALDRFPDIFLRENPMAHMSASAWIVNRGRDRVLMAWHNIYRSWSWLGGHADGERDLLAVALKETGEESGLRRVRPVDRHIFSLEVLTVDGHEKRGIYVPSHLHLNITYLLEADEEEALTVKPDENSALKWFPLDQAAQASSEPWMRERIYEKLAEKTRRKANQHI